ncbi:MAG: hypothetical protein QXP70_05085 [Methanomassiliicoccales archaeon]
MRLPECIIPVIDLTHLHGIGNGVEQNSIEEAVLFLLPAIAYLSMEAKLPVSFLIEREHLLQFAAEKRGDLLRLISTKCKELMSLALELALSGEAQRVRAVNSILDSMELAVEQLCAPMETATMSYAELYVNAIDTDPVQLQRDVTSVLPCVSTLFSGIIVASAQSSLFESYRKLIPCESLEGFRLLEKGQTDGGIVVPVLRPHFQEVDNMGGFPSQMGNVNVPVTKNTVGSPVISVIELPRSSVTLKLSSLFDFVEKADTQRRTAPLSCWFH